MAIEKRGERSKKSWLRIELLEFFQERRGRSHGAGPTLKDDDFARGKRRRGGQKRPEETG